MTILEMILIILLIIVIIVALYFFFRGVKGNLSVTRPVESRVDEYLDRRFDSMVTEWALVRNPAVNRFKEKHEPVLDHNEAKVTDLQGFEKEISSTLSGMEDRLDNLEKELAQIK
jgi:hypothetical protein